MNRGKSEVDWKAALYGGAIGALFAIIVSCIGMVCVMRHNEDYTDAKFAEAETKEEATAAGVDEIAVDAGVTAPTETGGDWTLTTAQGKEITYHIPAEHYNLTDEYLALVPSSLGLSNAVTAENFLITGDSQSVNTSVDSINIATFSELYNLYEQLYGEAFTQEGIEAVYSPAYTYAMQGSIPEDAPENYEIEELDSITNGDVTYRVFNVNYDTSYTYTTDADGNALDTPETQTVHTQHLAAYSDTEDAVEIVVYSSDNTPESESKLLDEFINGAVTEE